MIDCEINLILTWSENCVLTDVITQAARRNNPRRNAPTSEIFKIKDTKLKVIINY